MFYVPLAAVEEEEGQQGQDGDDDRVRDEDGASGVARQPVGVRVEDGGNLDRLVKERGQCD